MTNVNGLSEEEIEQLAILSEECGEVIQAVGKILRHGFDSHDPLDPDKVTNRDKLETELGDIDCVLTVMGESGSVNIDKVKTAAVKKRPRLFKYAHHLVDYKAHLSCTYWGFQYERDFGYEIIVPDLNDLSVTADSKDTVLCLAEAKIAGYLNNIPSDTPGKFKTVDILKHLNNPKYEKGFSLIKINTEINP